MTDTEQKQRNTAAMIYDLRERVADLYEAFEQSLVDKPRLLREEEAAAYISRSCSFLRKSRSDGISCQGPDYLKVGGTILYDKRDLDRWIDSLERRKASRTNLDEVA